MPGKKGPPTIMPEVVVHEKPEPKRVPTDLRTPELEKMPALRALDPLGEANKKLSKMGDDQRAQGNNGKAVALKAAGGTIEAAGAIAEGTLTGGPVGATRATIGVGTKMAVDHVHNPNVKIDDLAEKQAKAQLSEKYGPKLNIKEHQAEYDKLKGDTYEKLGAEYKAYEAIDTAAKPKTVGGAVGGAIGRLGVNSALGGDVLHGGGRPIDKFVDIKKDGGGMQEYNALQQSAKAGKGSLDPNDYRLAIDNKKKDHATTVGDLHSVLKKGGNGDEFVRAQRAGNVDEYKQELGAGKKAQPAQEKKKDEPKGKGRHADAGVDLPDHVLAQASKIGGQISSTDTKLKSDGTTQGFAPQGGAPLAANSPPPPVPGRGGASLA